MWHWKQRTERWSTHKPKQNTTNSPPPFKFANYFLHAFNGMYSLCSSLMCIYFTLNSTVERVLKKHAITQWTFTDHLIVLFRLGWLTVLSSMNIVEQELYFFESRPGETFGKDQHLIRLQKDVPYNQAQPQNKLQNTFTHVVYVIAFPPVPYWKERQGFCC